MAWTDYCQALLDSKLAVSKLSAYPLTQNARGQRRRLTSRGIGS
jgi:hypothetical protein